MKAKYITYTLGLLGLASCSVEAPFQSQKEEGTGFFSKASLSLDVKSDENIKIQNSRAENDLVNNFEINFQNSENNQVYGPYLYGEMPEVISLPEGTYTVSAVYGKDLDAEWNNPHFKGNSQEFSIVREKINTALDPIICSLQNVMVSVVFDDELVSHMSDEPEVTVYVNKDQPLVFTKSHSEALTPGYFKHSSVCTLTAVFKGTVDGIKLEETKTLNNIEKGHHYRLTFARHSFNGEDHGQAELEVMVDAKVSIDEVGEDYEVPEEGVMDNLFFPSEEQEDNNDPQQPEGPGTEQPGEKPTQPEEPGPIAELDQSSSVKHIDDGIPNIIDASSSLILKIHSDAPDGFEIFNIEIDSEFEDLKGMKLDFIEPGESLEDLIGFGFFDEADENPTLRGKHDYSFDITIFMGTLAGLGPGVHTFYINMGDALGTKQSTLILQVK